MLTFMINMVDLEDFLLMQGMPNSLVKGFVQFVFFHILDTVVQTIFRQTGHSAPTVIIACMPGHSQTGLQTCQWGAAES